ncbi:MBOAT family O-acyltransferase [Chiayiivirga flava]|uniref:Probable alginate O-acetylase n=1 Tax=Chiayiivirga flava TaxID=659595 RepID=A0A7W8D3Q4_9GAMM|nr:MBOAT family protein [Chiayiivirga flava]MBB5207388.1 alginate O-acetyltransferase complex protein AlgI [Chiayiivirga flava]
MQFDSLAFVLFFVLVLAGAALLRGWNARKNLLLVASYLFYAAWNPAFVLLLAGSSTFDWWLARRIGACDATRARKRWLLLSLSTNLGVLALFKYGGFLQHNIAAAFGGLGLAVDAPDWSLVLPVGISFYTFQSLSYTIDVYRRQVEPTRSLRDFCLFVAFFPQLVAGPIVRYADFERQLQVPRAPAWAGIAPGLALLVWGLFEKIVLADGLFAPVADAAFGAAAPRDAGTAWAGILAFSGQIFCDFAGYSCCAIGAARCLGFHLPVNFRQPYAALGFSDFWRRWHISLSTWLRDYLYVALGGNRGGRWRTYRNLLLTMLLGGLWHGAGWQYVAWGGLHGLYLALERAARDRFGFEPTALRVLRVPYLLLTLVVVVLTWIPFRAPDLGYALDYAGALFGGGAAALSVDQQFAITGFAALVATHCLSRNRGIEDTVARLPAPALAAALALLLVAIVLSPGETHAFIYFQF